jgi:hypothetical protein
MSRARTIALRVVLVVVVFGLLAVGRFMYGVYRPANAPLTLPAGLVDVDSPEGRIRLARAASADHAAMHASFVPQQHGSFCGIASSVIALNALGLGPVTQDSIFDARTAPVQTRAEAFFGGITLDELGGLLRARGAHVVVVHAEAGGLARFRESARANLARPGDVLVINYDRRVVHEVGGGHISPISAYDPTTDTFLLLDTAAYKYPAHWVPADALYRAMAMRDPSTGRTRGYVEASVP